MSAWWHWLGVFAAAWSFVFATTARGQDDTGSGWRLERMDLALRVDAPAATLTVSGTLTLRCDLDASFGPTLGLNTRSPFMAWVSVEPSSGVVEAIGATVEGFPATRATNVRRETPFTRGDRLEVAFETRAVETGGQFHVDDGYATASWVTGWTPFPAPLEGQGWGAWLTEASGTTRFDLPASWRAVTNGDRVSRVVDGDRALEVWTLEEALARSFAAGPFDESVVETGGRRVGVSLLSPKPGSAENQAATLGRAIDAMSTVFGPYPYDRFSIVEAPDRVQGFWAASEQGFILAKPGVFATADGNLPLFAHEAAHAWWGNLVGTDGPGGIFLSESVAQFGAVVAIERLEGPDAATEFLRFSREGYIANQCARGYFDVVRAGEDRPIATIERGGGVNHTIADSKGHWVHHMLRRRVGDAVYGATMRALIERFSERDISLEDFREAFIDAAPESRLGRFFAQWLDGAGAPALEHAWRVEGDVLVVEIEQAQREAPYELWLDVAIDLARGETAMERVILSGRSESFRFDGLDGEVVGVRLDPEHRLLLWTPAYGPAPHADPLAGVLEAGATGAAGSWAGGLETPDGYLSGVIRVESHDDRHSATFEPARTPGMRLPMSPVLVDGDRVTMGMRTPSHGVLEFRGRFEGRFLLGRAFREGSDSGARFEFVRLDVRDGGSLDAYAGTYRIGDRTLRIEADARAAGGVLRVVIGGEAQRLLFPVGDDVFVHGAALERPHPVEGTVQFERDGSGGVIAFERRMANGQAQRALRVHEP